MMSLLRGFVDEEDLNAKLRSLYQVDSAAGPGRRAAARPAHTPQNPRRREAAGIKSQLGVGEALYVLPGMDTWGQGPSARCAD
jgi:hypothetical protein